MWMVLSEDWRDWTTAARRAWAHTFYDTILDAPWWKRAEFFVKLLDLPYVVMCKTDSDAKGMMGRLYDLMLQLTEDIRDRLDEHAEGVLSRGEVGEVRKIVQDLTRKDGVERRASLVIQEGFTAFLNLQGSFGMPDAIANREAVKEGKMTAVAWWTWHGTDYPELTTLACRVLTQPVSASPCERNWAKFDAVHTARRNCLGSEKHWDLVGSYFKNPCYVGACINDGKGAYSCICPPNHLQSTTVDAFPTCDPASTTATTMAVSGDNWMCSDVHQLVGLSLDKFTLQNAVRTGTQLQSTDEDLASLNPGLDCSEPIKVGRSVCLERSSTFAYTVPQCLQYGKLTAQDTCDKLRTTSAGGVSWPEVYRNNPGLTCSATIPSSASSVGSNIGVQVRAMRGSMWRKGGGQ
ncbi:unnamed protein product [Closterium sp. Naga37s-1]|nr:unnamed protein product [Closterium sp. Naga37s-1]